MLCLFRVIDALLDWYIAFPPPRPRIAVIAWLLSGLLIGWAFAVFVWDPATILLPLLRIKKELPVPDAEYRYVRFVEPHDEAIPIPASLTPFLDRVVSSLTAQSVPWADSLPVLESPRVRSASQRRHADHLTDLRLQVLGLLSPTGIRAWHLDYEERINQADRRNAELWDQGLEVLGYLAYCAYDPEAHAVLAWLHEEDQRGLLIDPAAWGGALTCAWHRLKLSTGSEKGLAGYPFEQTSAGLNELCTTALTDNDTWTAHESAFRTVASEAHAIQRQILARLSFIADEEAIAFLKTTIIPQTISRCRHLRSTAWFPPKQSHRSSQTYIRCLNETSTRLLSVPNTFQGPWIPLSWSSAPPPGTPPPTSHTSSRLVPGDPGDFGTGVRLYKRGRDTVASVNLPREKAEGDMDDLFQDFLMAVVTEMVSKAGEAGVKGVRGLCERERSRQYAWMDSGRADEAEGVLSSDPSEFTLKGLLSKSLHFLARLGDPFTSPRRYVMPPPSTTPDDDDDVDDDDDDVTELDVNPYLSTIPYWVPGLNDNEFFSSSHHRRHPAARFLRSEIQDWGCSYLSSGLAYSSNSTRGASANELDSWIVPALGEEYRDGSQGRGERDLVEQEWEHHILRLSFLRARESVWRFWDGGLEGWWRVAWVEGQKKEEEPGSRSKGDAPGGRKQEEKARPRAILDANRAYRLDLGGQAGVLNRGWCKKRGARFSS
ncbi:hypothetical protein Tdes44962_MAKER08250 [Teratosphaeria destructans]|uniref:Uncharacterized protein n=1 Tax=Teratosphaeria destructans TaxID=418781 RepID=A0A9W7W567_9PEZI|nr:hypothetical protein Tdes44962_MAKER08250 [Teratosphaeria destructans]